ncbi:MAG: TRAP transporter substrate-binding protein DctP, partial [Calditrichia bacterium]
QINYLLDAPFLYIYGVFAVDRKAFSKISPEDQSIVRKVMGRVFQEIDHKNRKDNIMAMETLQKQGIQFVKPSAEELNEWYTIASTLPKRLIKTGKISQYMLDTLENNLQDFRSQ